MATMHDVMLVLGVAADYEIDAISLTNAGEIMVRGGSVTEYYDTAEEAIGAIRASWRIDDGEVRS